MAIFNKVSDAMGESPSLSGTRAGHNQYRSVARQNSFALLIVEELKCLGIIQTDFDFAGAAGGNLQEVPLAPSY